MLTEEEKQRIREEEELRKQVRGASPVNQLSSCILWVIALVVIGIVGFCLLIGAMVNTVH